MFGMTTKPKVEKPTFKANIVKSKYVFIIKKRKNLEYFSLCISLCNLVKEDILLKVFSTAQVRKIREIRNGASEK